MRALQHDRAGEVHRPVDPAVTRDDAPDDAPHCFDVARVEWFDLTAHRLGEDAALLGVAPREDEAAPLG